MPDIKELRRILNIIADETKMPRGTTWDQGYWFHRKEIYLGNEQTVCGTAMCFAGWKVYLDGYTKLVHKTDPGYSESYVDGQLVNPETGKAIEYWAVRDYAMNALDLDEEQADLLFDEANDFDDLENCVNDIEMTQMTQAEFARALRD